MESREIQSRDLRIGNILMCQNTLCDVIGLHQHTVRLKFRRQWNDTATIHFKLAESKTIEPIPLDPAWLGRMGFELQSFQMSGCDIWQKDFWRIAKSFLKDREGEPFHLFHERISPPTWSLGTFQYVHQVQNCFHALTGNELEVKN